MKVFYKSHYYEGENTWLIVHFDKPIRDSEGRLCDGRFNIQLGKAEHIKSAFKMSVDECRALIDALKNAVKKNDEFLVSLLNPPSEVEVFDNPLPIEKQEPELNIEPDSFKLFETKEKDVKPEVYY